jgi:hypothetical protein
MMVDGKREEYKVIFGYYNNSVYTKIVAKAERTYRDDTIDST